MNKDGLYWLDRLLPHAKRRRERAYCLTAEGAEPVVSIYSDGQEVGIFCLVRMDVEMDILNLIRAELTRLGIDHREERRREEAGVRRFLLFATPD